MLLCFSAWLTCVPRPLRAAHGTQPPKMETPRLVAPELPSRAVARKRRTRTGVAGSHKRVVQSLQQRHQLLRQRLGVRMRMASASAHKVAMEVHAQFIPQADCREIQKLAKRVSGRHEQASKDGSPPPRQQSGKEKASDSEAAAGEELGYQSPAR